jgi:hypothetical protein
MTVVLTNKAFPALNTAVLTAYGFSAKKDLLAQLLALNQEVSVKIESSAPVTGPGVPEYYPDASKLVAGDCIRPDQGEFKGSSNLPR